MKCGFRKEKNKFTCVTEVTDGPRSAGLERSKTTPAPAPQSAREIGKTGVPSPKGSDFLGAGLARSNTQITPARPSPNATVGGPMRSLSIRKPGASPSNPLVQPKGKMFGALCSPFLTRTLGSNSRLTEIYDGYIDSYGSGEGDATPFPDQSAGSDRVGAWARSNANPNYPPIARTGSRSAPNNQPPPSSYQPPQISHDGLGGGGSLRRKVTKRSNPRASRIQSTYEEEEEGYVSGEYDDGPFDLTIIRIKVGLPDFIVCDLPPLTLSYSSSFITKMRYVA